MHLLEQQLKYGSVIIGCGDINVMQNLLFRQVQTNDYFKRYNKTPKIVYPSRLLLTTIPALPHCRSRLSSTPSGWGTSQGQIMPTYSTISENQ